MKTAPLGTALILAALGSAGCGGDDATLDTPLEAPNRGGDALHAQRSIDARRSIMITDRAVLDSTQGKIGARRFSMRRVLDQLASDNGNAALDAPALFRQLWDTQNPAPGYTHRGPHCDDPSAMLHGRALSCRPVDGHQAKGHIDEILDGYFPVALVNRFDLASPDGRSCGEYRIIFSKGAQLPGRAMVIFEAALENPTPELGLAACEPVQRFWASLSDAELSASERAEALDDFYFRGFASFPPVIRVAAFDMASEHAGQIRTNTFMDRPWSLRELKLSEDCSTGTCDLLFVPVSVKANPFGPLFGGDDATALAFQADFASENVERLATHELAGIGYARADDTYNAPESTDNADLDFTTWFSKGGTAFRSQIQARLDALGSSLTPDQIVVRARTQSCMGCHQRTNGADLGDGMTWPRSLGFVHVSDALEDGPEGPRYVISDALTDVLLPARKSIIETYLGFGAEAVAARAPHLDHATLSGARH